MDVNNVYCCFLSVFQLYGFFYRLVSYLNLKVFTFHAFIHSFTFKKRIWFGWHGPRYGGQAWRRPHEQGLAGMWEVLIHWPVRKTSRFTQLFLGINSTYQGMVWYMRWYIPLFVQAYWYIRSFMCSSFRVFTRQVRHVIHPSVKSETIQWFNGPSI